MSLFYVLPPRPFLGDELAEYLRNWLPGLDWDVATRANLCEAIKAAATCRPDVFVVFREELPEGVVTSQALRDEFGAEEGDEVVEVRSFSAGAVQARRWPVRHAA